MHNPRDDFRDFEVLSRANLLNLLFNAACWPESIMPPQHWNFDALLLPFRYSTTSQVSLPQMVCHLPPCRHPDLIARCPTSKLRSERPLARQCGFGSVPCIPGIATHQNKS